MIGIFFALLVAYIIGSFPIGFWMGQVFFKKDVTMEGSGNIGATNVYRVLGPAAGLVVFAGDFLKGAAPVFMMKAIRAPENMVPWLVVAAGLLAIIGHTFSVFLKFKGGKGAATAVGVIMVLMPLIGLIIFATWFLTLAVTRYVSVSSMLAAIALPVLTVFMYGQNSALIVFSFLVALLVLYKHRSNIGRLIKGTEPKVGTQNES